MSDLGTTKLGARSYAACQAWLRKVYIITSLVLALGTSKANAQTTSGATSESPAQSSDKEQWYGLPIVIADATALAALGGAALVGGRTSVGLLGSSALIYLAAGPLVHLSQHQPTNAGMSAGLRVLPFSVGGTLILGNSDSREPVAVWTGVGVVLVGGLAAMVVDIAALAWKPLEAARTSFMIAPARTPDGSSLWTATMRW